MKNQRQISIVTSLGKKYTGLIDISSPDLRTTDFFNAVNVYWKNPTDKCFQNAVLLHDARLILDDSLTYRKFDKIQVMRAEIIYFYDDSAGIGDEGERQRASLLVQKPADVQQRVNIITKVISNSFFDIDGIFNGHFKRKANEKFIPLTDAEGVEITKKDGKWTKKKITLPEKFIGISNRHIEAAVVN